MPLELKGCLSQTCDGLSYKDITGPYDATDNTGGYGTENVITGPADFDTYELRLWDPTNNYYSDTPVPTATLDLLDAVPTPNSSGFYTWEFIASQLGMTAILDGTWYWEVTGTKDADEYTTQGFAIFLGDLEASINTKVKAYDPLCPCKKGCTDASELYAKSLVLKCFGTCDAAAANDVIKWLKSQLKNCC